MKLFNIYAIYHISGNCYKREHFLGIRNTYWLASILFIYLFGVLRRFQQCAGNITTGSWKGRGNQYIQFARVVYCKLRTNGKQLPAMPLKAITRIEPQPQRWEARVLLASFKGFVLFYCKYLKQIADRSNCKEILKRVEIERAGIDNTAFRTDLVGYFFNSV